MNVSVLKVIRRAKRNFYAVSIVLIMLFVAKNVLKTMNHLKLMGDKMIVYRFDKERFNKNADKGIKRILSKHLDYIDNLEVKFIDGEEWGTVENYVVGQERYCLYPVKKEWCSIEEQLRIIWNYCELIRKVCSLKIE